MDTNNEPDGEVGFNAPSPLCPYCGLKVLPPTLSCSYCGKNAPDPNEEGRYVTPEEDR